MENFLNIRGHSITTWTGFKSSFALVYFLMFFMELNGSPPTNPVALVVTLCVFYIE